MIVSAIRRGMTPSNHCVNGSGVTIVFSFGLGEVTAAQTASATREAP